MISVIVPVYNIEQYIDKCISSILMQTYTDYELILVDDGSTDNSGLICDKYAQSDNKVKVIHKNNGGLVETRHVGASVAEGDYIICVDGDDWIGKDRLELLNHAIENSHADMVFMDGVIKVYENGKKDNDIHDIREGLYEPSEVIDLLADTKYCFRRVISAMSCSWATKKELYLKIMNNVDKSVIVGEDFLFSWLALLSAKSVYLTKNPSYYYYQREGSLSKKSDDGVAEQLKKAYSCIDTILAKTSENMDCYRNNLIFATMRILVATCLNKLLIQSKSFLYPYSKIKQGSSIIVYGAGDVGSKLIQFLAHSPQYNIVGWVDKFSGKYEICGIPKVDFSDLYKCEYDYIALAVVDYDLIERIKKDLIDMGVSKEKIACMDANVIDEEHLKNCFNLSFQDF